MPGMADVANVVAEASADASVEATAFTPYFCVGTVKLLVMTEGTFGLYPIYWFKENWEAEQENTHEMFHPAVRAIFCVIFFYSFAARTKDRAEDAGVPARFSPVLLAIAFFVMVFSGRFPDPWWLMALVSALPIVPVQMALKRINSSRGIAAGPEARFSALNIIWLIVVGILMLMAVAGWLLGDLEPDQGG
jgi:hypothetical protein